MIQFVQIAFCCFVLIGVPFASSKTIFPGEEWEKATPESQGIDGKALQKAIDYLHEHSGNDGVNELAIIRNGYLLWEGVNIDKQHGVWSMTKSFTSTILGLLIDEGKCSLDTLAKDILPEMAASYPHVTLRHFTTMTSGYRANGDETTGSYTHGPSSTPFDPSPKPLFTPPGSQYAYWDSAMNQFAHILTRIAGEKLEDFFARNIADPIGMNRKKWDWGEFPVENGIPINGGSGNSSKHMMISAREAARFGWLYLNQGQWNGKQLISKSWIAAACSAQVPNTIPLAEAKLSSSNGPGVYGFNWWVNGIQSNGNHKWPSAPLSTYCASGYNNNDLFIVPEWNMVIVRLGLDQGDHLIHDAEYDEFLRQIGESIQ